MKVLIINGSPHKDGTTKKVIDEFINKMNSFNDVEINVIDLETRDIRGCIACNRCRELKRCIFEDELLTKTKELLKESDCLLIGTPVYYASPNGSLISFLDRLFYSKDFSVRLKVGASIGVARRSGTVASIDVINKYFTISEMVVVSSSYWNNVFGLNENDVQFDEEGLQTIRNLATNMYFVSSAIKEKKEKEEVPSNTYLSHTNFVK